MRYINILSQRNEGFSNGYVKPILEAKQLLDEEITGENLQAAMIAMADHSWHCNAMWMFDLTSATAQSERNRLIKLIERAEKKAFKDTQAKMVAQIAQAEKTVAASNAKLEREHQAEQTKINTQYNKYWMHTLSVENETEEQAYQRNRQFAMDRAATEYDWRYYTNKLESEYSKKRLANEEVVRKLHIEIRDTARPLFEMRSLKYFEQLAHLFVTCAEVHNASGYDADPEDADGEFEAMPDADLFDDPIDHEYDTRR